MSQPTYTIALTGNPNSGKTSLFNALTGLNQKVGNFPGVTVDKKTGSCYLTDKEPALIIDLPGTYSIYPRSRDEQVACEVLLNPQHKNYPDLIVVVADASNLKRNLLYCSQIMDLGKPVVMALTMNDLAEQKGTRIDLDVLSTEMSIPVVAINPRNHSGIPLLKETIFRLIHNSQEKVATPFIPLDNIAPNFLLEIQQLSKLPSPYAALQLASFYEEAGYLDETEKKQIETICTKYDFQKSRVQAEEILSRYQKIDEILLRSVRNSSPQKQAGFTSRADKILLHPLWGTLLLLLIMLIIFQSLYGLAAYPMDWIDAGFSGLTEMLDGVLPDSLWKDLLLNGILAGIGGIIIFVPQIALLFGFITLLEDTGYMARISFLSDRLLHAAGLNGKSVLPLISGVACAIPAVMAARTIQNRKERLLTIMVTPLMSCSARLPVYTILIALVVPDKMIGIFNLQGLVLMGLYFLGLVTALLVAWIMKLFVRVKESSFFILELPEYRMPRWKNLWVSMLEKARIFVVDAGKIIFIISIILWGLSTFGPAKKMDAIEDKYTQLISLHPEKEAALEREKATERLAGSYAGIIGKTIEPAIQPLGYDWKIGIAIITSFAAREVFVGTMATLYSVEETESMDQTLMERMRQAKKADGTPVYTLASGISLIIFYAFAMQCMSTLAIVKRETGSWKYPAIQFLYMLALAYAGAFAAFRFFS